MPRKIYCHRCEKVQTADDEGCGYWEDYLRSEGFECPVWGVQHQAPASHEAVIEPVKEKNDAE